MIPAEMNADFDKERSGKFGSSLEQQRLPLEFTKTSNKEEHGTVCVFFFRWMIWRRFPSPRGFILLTPTFLSFRS